MQRKPFFQNFWENAGKGRGEVMNEKINPEWKEVSNNMHYNSRKNIYNHVIYTILQKMCSVITVYQLF